MQYFGILCSIMLLWQLAASEISRSAINELEAIIQQYKSIAYTKKETDALSKASHWVGKEAASAASKEAGPSSLAKTKTKRTDHIEDATIKTLDNLDHPNLEDVVDVKGRRCSKGCRLTFNRCVVEHNSVKTPTCAASFVQCYPSCFFHQIPESAKKDAVMCNDACLKNFDQCIFPSTKVEEVLCMRKRGECRGVCPGNKVKRGCLEDCEAEFILCENAITHFLEADICRVNDIRCKRVC